MKYATEVIDLMAAYPGRGWKMAEIVRHVSGGRELDATERDETRKGVYRVLCLLVKGGQVACRQAHTRGAPAEFLWRCASVEMAPAWLACKNIQS